MHLSGYYLPCACNQRLINSETARKGTYARETVGRRVRRTLQSSIR
jgi:hypothetical protein